MWLTNSNNNNRKKEENKGGASEVTVRAAGTYMRGKTRQEGTIAHRVKDPG